MDTEKENSSFSSTILASEDLYQSYPYYIIGSISLFCFIIGFPGSLINFSYFFSLKRNLSNVQNLMISGTDSVITFLLLFNALSKFSYGHPMMFQFTWFCVMWGITWNASIRFSVFLVAVLNVTRTASLVNPFLRIKIKTVVVPSVLYLFILVGQQFTPIIFGKKYGYNWKYSICSWYLTNVFDFGSVELKVLTFLFDTLEFCFPCLTIAIISIVAMWVLCRHHSPGNAQGNYDKLEATKTIMYLTVAYMVFNIPFTFSALYWSVVVISGNLSHYNLFHDIMGLVHGFEDLLFIHSLVLNSTINVLIYLGRKRELR